MSAHPSTWPCTPTGTSGTSAPTLHVCSPPPTTTPSLATSYGISNLYIAGTIPGGELGREEGGGGEGGRTGRGTVRSKATRVIPHPNPNPTDTSARPTCEGDDQRIVVGHLGFIFVLLPWCKLLKLSVRKEMLPYRSQSRTAQSAHSGLIHNLHS